MNKSLAIKLALMAAIMLLLLIPIAQIKGLVDERHDRHQEVIEDIAASSSTEQLIIGPILVQPYTQKVAVWKTDSKSGKRELEEKEKEGELYFLPASLQVDVNLSNETRSRGIYEAQIYHADTRLKGSFSIPENFGLTHIEDYQFHEAYLLASVSDMRGIESAVKLSLDNQQIEVFPGPNNTSFRQGIHANIPALSLAGSPDLPFELSLKLQGTTSLEIVPMGKETKVKLQSDWPHPSFMGRFLPLAREVSPEGFSAQWEMSFFSTNIPAYSQECFEKAQCSGLKSNRFGVTFVDPVDLYVKADRAIKYAVLFVLLTFAGVFLFEVLKRLRVHPIQYALVGLAIAMFYLLLMSLAEHLSFVLSYLISAISCAGLIGTYVGHALRSALRGLYFGLGLMFLYALFYGLLSSEDYALLTGSILSFGVLAIVMLTTRQLDWYKLGEQLEPFATKERATHAQEH